VIEAVFVTGVLLWIASRIMKASEDAERDERVKKRHEELMAEYAVARDERNARIWEAIKQGYRDEGYDVDRVR
jgi:hypothetical protein